MKRPHVDWLDPLLLEWRPLGRLYTLYRPLRVIVGDALYTAPGGMETDGASIPRVLWRVVGPPMLAPYVRAAVIHDAACRGVLSGFTGDHVAAADLFGALMDADGVGPVRRRSMVRAVKLFGPQWSAR